jgi:hypothetical protein
MDCKKILTDLQGKVIKFKEVYEFIKDSEKANKINELEFNIGLYKTELEMLLEEGQFILDDEVVDEETFETVRPATEYELELFYGIRLSQLKIKEIKRTLIN